MFKDSNFVTSLPSLVSLFDDLAGKSAFEIPNFETDMKIENNINIEIKLEPRQLEDEVKLEHDQLVDNAE